MKEQFIIVLVLVIFLLQGCSTCFLDNSVNNRSVTTGSSFYEECCCTVSGSDLKQLQWYDPFDRVIEPLGPGTDVYIEEQGECLSLVIKSSSKTLAGPYRCVTTVDGVQHSQVHYLDVYDQLYFFNTPRNQYLVHNNNSLITCQATGATPPFIRWYIGKDGQNEIFNGTVKYEFMPEGLLVKNVNNDDGGIYRCTASVLSTGEEVEMDIDVRVMTRPVITELTASPEAVVTANDPLMIMCSAEGLPDPAFNWTKISEASPGEERNISWKVQLNNTIRFDSILPEDAGTYECIAHNFVGTVKKQINIVVQIPPQIIGFNNITALEGTEIPIYCNVSGIPEPNVTITYEGKSLNEVRESEYAEIIPNYSLLKVDRNNEGIYICNATNYVDSTSEIMTLSVLRPPYFEKTFETLWGWSGETVIINCAHDSNPPADITWRYVKGYPFSTIEKYDIVLDYETASEQIFPFSDKFAPFGIYECQARNDYGAAAKVYHIRKGFPPSAVVNVTTIDETATSATFDIEPPHAYEGPNVIGFVAEYDEAANYEITNIHPNRTWAVGVPFKLEKLKPNTTYRIRFAAINRVGTGEWGHEGIEFDTMDKSAPEPPIWLVDPVQIASDKVLKWKAPENNGEPIDFYALRYCPVNDDDEVDDSLCKEYRLAPTTELEVSDLEYNTTYYLELIAHNSEGNSTPANTSVTLSEAPSEPASLLSGGVVIGISVVIVIICLLLLDLLLLFWRKQGIIASCCYKKNKKRKPNPLNSRDKKGLLKDNGESSTDDTLRRPNNGHKEYEYNKNTGIITGKHSSV